MANKKRAPLIIHHEIVAEKKLKTLQSAKYGTTSGLSIVTTHNYSNPGLFEKSLDVLGVTGYTVLNKPVKSWRMSFKLSWVVDYIESGKCEDLILFCDSRDAVITNNPQQAIDFFQSYDAQIIFGATTFREDYRFMPEVLNWTEQNHSGWYLNAGAWIGKKDYVLKLFKQALKYVPEHKPIHAGYENLKRISSTGFRNFPTGIDCDQIILRYMEPNWPGIVLDKEGLLIRKRSHSQNRKDGLG